MAEQSFPVGRSLPELNLSKLAIVERKLALKGAHFHRLRDAFAVELLLKGAPIEALAILLGHPSIRVTEKHYSPWAKARQQRLEGHVKSAWVDDPILSEPYNLRTTLQ